MLERLLRQGSVTSVILVGRSDPLGFQRHTHFDPTGRFRTNKISLVHVRVASQNEKEGDRELSIDIC